MSPTKEQIDAAVTWLRDRDGAFGMRAKESIDTLLAALSQAEAEFQEAHAKELEAWSHCEAAQQALDTERAAHAETRREQKEAVDSAATHYVNYRILQGVVSEWQHATGSPSPEAYQQRVEPSGDVIEKLAEQVRVAWVAWAKTQPTPKPSWLVPWADLGQQDQDADRAIAKHIVRELAAMVAEVFPNAEDVITSWPPEWKTGTPNRTAIDAVIAIATSRLAPVLGARVAAWPTE